MACARPESTLNPDAMKFTLDVTLPDRLLASRGDDVNDPFVRALLAIDGVASVFGINDFVTVTRERGADWGSIVGAVEAAAVKCLPSGAIVQTNVPSPSSSFQLPSITSPSIVPSIVP